MVCCKYGALHDDVLFFFLCNGVLLVWRAV